MTWHSLNHAYLASHQLIIALGQDQTSSQGSTDPVPFSETMAKTLLGSTKPL